MLNPKKEYQKTCKLLLELDETLSEIECAIQYLKDVRKEMCKIMDKISKQADMLEETMT